MLVRFIHKSGKKYSSINYTIYDSKYIALLFSLNFIIYKF